jgi:bifunctional aspartokinase / homoserine dehydrogenase 1
MSPEQQQVSANAEGDLGPGERESSVERALAYASESRILVGATVAFKFGGSSLEGAARMKHAAGLVRQAVESGGLPPLSDGKAFLAEERSSAGRSVGSSLTVRRRQAAALQGRVTVVVSAMKGVTDRLLCLANLLRESRNPAARNEAEGIVELHFSTLRGLQLQHDEHERVVEHELKLLSADLLHEIPTHGKVKITAALIDRLASFGERFAARLFAAALVAEGVAAVPVSSSEFVLTCENFQDAQPQLEHTRKRGRQVLLPLLEAGLVPVVTGFIGATKDGRITTLGRNSSDFSGALIAHVVDAEELVIWTDVDGIFTANPRETQEAQLLHELSYEEAHALAASGAKVLHPHVLPLAAQTGMTVWVRNTFKPQTRGTRIAARAKGGTA